MMAQKQTVRLAFALWCMLVLGTTKTFGQGKEITKQELYWIKLGTVVEFSDKWQLTVEVDNRRFISPNLQHQLVSRTALHRSLGANWWGSVGFTYFLQYPHDPEAANRLIVPEVRPHQELYYRQKINSRFQLQHNYRSEQRYFRKTDAGTLASGYNFNWRFRYRIGLSWLLTKPESKTNTFSLVVFDEIFINAGKKIVVNSFDQNRIYIGLNYKPVPNTSIELGYMNWFQENAKATQYTDRNIVRLQIQQRIKTKKKE